MTSTEPRYRGPRRPQPLAALPPDDVAPGHLPRGTSVSVPPAAVGINGFAARLTLGVQHGMEGGP